MKMIKQRNDNDCMLAAVAMVAGKEYDDIYTPEFVQKVVDARGCNHELTMEVMARAGLKPWTIYVHGHLDSYERRLLLGRTAVFSVASLNNRGGGHAVAWDGRDVFDPSPKLIYQWLEHLVIETIYTFDEVKR